jgi:hypothetical protein
MKMNKKGDAAIIATVFLIVAAIGIGILVTSFSRQTEEKVSDKIVTLGSAVDCEDVRISIDKVEGGNVFLTNRGSLGVEKIFLRVYEEDRTESFERELGSKLMPQKDTKVSIPTGYDPYKVEGIPVIKTDDEEEIGCENRVSIWEK